MKTEGESAMLKRVLLLINAPLLILSIGLLPQAIINNTVQAEFTFVDTKQIAERVRAYGEVCPGEEYEVYLPSAAVAKNVFVSVGNQVKKGTVLASVDQWLDHAAEDGASVLDDKVLMAAAEYGVLPEDILPSFANHDAPAHAKQSAVQADSKVYAPVDGIVTEVNLKSGTALDCRKPAVRMEIPNTKSVRLFLPETAAQHVSIGDPVVITSNSFPNVLNGTIREIGESAKQREMTGGREVDILVGLLENTSRLKNGFTVEGMIQLEEPRWANIIPYEAVHQDKANQEYVYLYVDGRAARRNITVKKELPDGVEVEDGLDGTETLLVSEEKLHEGERIMLKGEYHG